MKAANPVLRKMMLWQALIALAAVFLILSSLFFINKTQAEKALEESRKSVGLALETYKDRLALFDRMEMDQAKTDLLEHLRTTYSLSEVLVFEGPQAFDRNWVEAVVDMGDKKYFLYASTASQHAPSLLNLSAPQLIVLASLLVIMLVFISFSYFFVYSKIFKPLYQLREKLQSVHHSKDFEADRIAAIGEIREVLGEVQRIYDRSLELESERIEQELSRRLAHDLRSPLIALRVLFRGVDMGEKKELLQKIASRIGDLADRLTRTAQRSQERSKEEPFNFEELLLQIVEEKRLQYQPHKELQIQLRSEILPGAAVVNADSYEVARLLSNLLDNAIEATIEKSSPLRPIVLSLRIIERGNLRLSIRDFGGGIPVSILTELGKKQVTTKAKGVGLGFLNAKESLEAMGGSVRILSEENVGTEVILGLPTVKALRQAHGKKQELLHA